MMVGPREGQSTRPQDFQTDRNFYLEPFLMNSVWISIKEQKGRKEMAGAEKEKTKSCDL